MSRKVPDAKLLEALIVHGGASGAAAVLGISRRAIYKRLQDEDFRRQYDAMQGVLLSSAAAGMCDALSEAVELLRSVINNEEANTNTRVAAADSLLRHCARYVELSAITGRLDEVERTLEQLEGNR